MPGDGDTRLSVRGCELEHLEESQGEAEWAGVRGAVAVVQLASQAGGAAAEAGWPVRGWMGEEPPGGIWGGREQVGVDGPTRAGAAAAGAPSPGTRHRIRREGERERKGKVWHSAARPGWGLRRGRGREWWPPRKRGAGLWEEERQASR